MDFNILNLSNRAYALLFMQIVSSIEQYAVQQSQRGRRRFSNVYNKNATVLDCCYGTVAH